MPMPDPFRRENRGLLGIAAGALLIIGAVGVMEWRRRPDPAKGREAVFAATGLPMGAPPLAASRPAPGLAGQPQVLDSSDFDKLVELFRGNSEVPAAQEFAKEFQADPEMKKEWDDFAADQKSDEPKDTLQAFAKRLSDNPEFRQLVARYSQDPGFRDVALRLSQDPKIKEAMQQVIASARAAPPTMRAGKLVARVPAGRGSLGGAAQGASAFGNRNPQFARGGLGNQLETAGAAAGSSGSRGGQAGGRDDDLSGGPAKVNLGGGTADGSAKGGAAPSGASSPGAHNVQTSLGDGPRNAPTTDFRKELTGWLGRFGLDADTYLREAGGIWDLCFKRGELLQCHNACKDPPKFVQTTGADICKKPSGEEPYWSACLQAYGENEAGEQRCLKACQAQDPPCNVPDDMVEKWCHEEIHPPACRTPAGQQAIANAYNRLKTLCGALVDRVPPGGVDCDGTDGTTDSKPPVSGQVIDASMLGYNYNTATRKFVVHPDEKKVIQKLFALFTKGNLSTIEVARRMNDAFPEYSKRFKDQGDSNGHGFTQYNVATLMRRRAYEGTERYERVVDPKTWKLAQQGLRAEMKARDGRGD